MKRRSIADEVEAAGHDLDAPLVIGFADGTTAAFDLRKMVEHQQALEDEADAFLASPFGRELMSGLDDPT